jgi:hypothetical protein
MVIEAKGRCAVSSADAKSRSESGSKFEGKASNFFALIATNFNMTFCSFIVAYHPVHE